MTSRADAQRRADQVAAFRHEVAALQAEGVALDTAQLEAVRSHHDALLAALTREHDVDATLAARQMSLGMRAASLLGAAALTAAIVSFVCRVWSSLPETGQVALLTAAPLAGVLAMSIAARLEKTRYVASLFASVACAAFVMQTVMLGSLFNMRSSPHTVAAWSLFALAVAWPWRFWLPYAFAVGAAAVYVPAVLMWALGYHWAVVFERPDALILPAVLLLPLNQRAPADLVIAGRTTLLGLVLIPLLFVSSTSVGTLLPMAEGTARVVYQMIAVAVAIALIADGIRARHEDKVMLGSVFAGIFILIRFVDWWWDWMPKYLFFLILAALALGGLWVLRVMRRRVKDA